jgi:hypothetical protein
MNLTPEALTEIMTRAVPWEVFEKAAKDDRQVNVTLTDRNWFVLLAASQYAVRRAEQWQPTSDDNLKVILLTGDPNPMLSETVSIHNQFVDVMRTSPALNRAGQPFNDEEVTLNAPVYLMFAAATHAARALVEMKAQPQDVTDVLHGLWTHLKPQIAALLPGFGDGLD